MKSNSAGIPADDEAEAKAILKLARNGLTTDLLGCMVDRDFGALARYGTRQATMALREGSVTRLRYALLAAAIADIGRVSDPRDVMVELAVHYFVAQQAGADPSVLFGEVASLLPDGWMPNLLREFGGRQDITLKAFGWRLVQTPDGPDFMYTTR